MKELQDWHPSLARAARSAAVPSLRAYRIAMCSDSYLPRISGVVHSLHAMAGALRAQGHRVVIAAPRYPGYVDADPDVVRFPSLRPPHQPDFPLALPYAPAAWRRLAAEPFDIVHTHSPFLMGAAASRLAGRMRAPLVFTHHTLYDEYIHYAPFVSARVSAPAVRRFVTRYANRCAAVVAPSAWMAHRLRDQGVRARIAVVPTGALDPALVAALDPSGVRAAYGIPPHRPLLVTASRLAREKSVELVLRAFAHIAAGREAALLVVGGGPEEAALRALAAELGVADRTVFTGLLPQRRALECMAAGDVFLYASQTETQGLVVIEAMAAAVPVVAVAAGGVSDAIRDGETGALVPPDPQAIAARALALLDDPERRHRLGRAGAAAAQAYTLETVTRQLVELYASIVPDHRPNQRRVPDARGGS